jgi:hypothetical protein
MQWVNSVNSVDVATERGSLLHRPGSEKGEGLRGAFSDPVH